MDYKGKLYGKFGSKYFDTGKTSDDYDRLENNHNWIRISENKTYPPEGKATLLLLSCGVIIIGYWYPKEKLWMLRDDPYCANLFDVDDAIVEYWQELPSFPKGFNVK